MPQERKVKVTIEGDVITTRELVDRWDGGFSVPLWLAVIWWVIAAVFIAAWIKSAPILGWILAACYHAPAPYSLTWRGREITPKRQINEYQNKWDTFTGSLEDRMAGVGIYILRVLLFWLFLLGPSTIARMTTPAHTDAQVPPGAIVDQPNANEADCLRDCGASASQTPASPLQSAVPEDQLGTYCMNAISLAKARFGEDWRYQIDAQVAGTCAHFIRP